jgi:hypothetical protein
LTQRSKPHTHSAPDSLETKQGRSLNDLLRLRTNDAAHRQESSSYFDCAFLALVLFVIFQAVGSGKLIIW